MTEPTATDRPTDRPTYERTDGRTEDKKKNQGAPVHLAVTLYCSDDVNAKVNENKWLDLRKLHSTPCSRGRPEPFVRDARHYDEGMSDDFLFFYDNGPDPPVLTVWPVHQR